jgi:hypothetical protein
MQIFNKLCKDVIDDWVFLEFSFLILKLDSYA